MAELNPPWALENLATHHANVNRMLMSVLSGRGEGVAYGLAVVQRGAGANMSVDVGAGVAGVFGDENEQQGIYGVVNDAAKNTVIAAADPTNPRRDLIVCRVRDAFYSGATNAWDLFVVQGTPAGSPVDPAVPNNALVLARVAVGAAVGSILTANITDLRPFLFGGVMPVNSARRPGVLYGPFTQEAAAGFRPAPVNGTGIYETDTLGVKFYDGSNWRYVGHPYAKTVRTAGDLTLTSTVWANVDTGIDIALPAIAGDVIEVTLDGQYNIAAGSAALIDCRCVTSSTYFGSAVETNTGNGILGWQSAALAGSYGFNGTFYRTIIAGDITAGVITLRLRYRLTAATNQTLQATATVPLTFFARNLGPDVG